jgi:DNA-directed RNA polymerase subunit RPC12/RpoP
MRERENNCQGHIKHAQEQRNETTTGEQTNCSRCGVRLIVEDRWRDRYTERQREGGGEGKRERLRTGTGEGKGAT